MTASIQYRSIHKSFGETEVLRGIDRAVKAGEFIVFVGPSGCGKSTTLRLLAGLEESTSGDILIGDRVVNNLEPKERNIAMVFQNYAIYPHMSVRKNIAFGLKTAKMSKEDKEKRIDEVGEILGMSELLERRPAQLSGGQRQRVAIGRAMVRDPSVFLFDEPLSNLDAQLRTQMRLEIKKLHQRMGTTIIFVTHDQVEAMTLADRIVIMKDGHIQQVGTPTEVYDQPANLFVAQFIGAPSMNVLTGTSVEKGIQLDVGKLLQVDVGSAGQTIKVGVRPNNLTLSKNKSKALLSGQVSIIEPLGAETLIYVMVGDEEVVATISGKEMPALGETVYLAAPFEELHFFDGETGDAIFAK
ncbi:MAG: sn-glycerol-3-phosphate ABC transporter ATP-binding protein UgpC [Devosiaceae bacterium]|nr:sn-glycerol-3-phosphate ABC transporter ATP-binding protein UgpC [Devosiaceae bacterium]